MVNQLIQQHSQGAYAMAVQMLRCKDEAQDVIQDACYALLRQARLPTDSSQFRMLLFKVVRNKVIDRVRAQKIRRSEPLNEETVAASDQDNPEAYWQQQQTKVSIKQALAALSMEHRDIILLKDWQGFSYADIANILEIEAGTVMSRLHRARLALRQQMQLCQSEVKVSHD